MCVDGVGAFTGLMAEIYSLVYLKKRNMNVIKAQELNHIVFKSMTVIERYLKENCPVELLSGLSGIIGVYLATIPCLDVKQQKAVLSFIKDLVERLKISVIEKEEGIYSWVNNSDIGYAHGNSGIITQLYRYYKVSHDIEILNIIEGAIEFERKYCFDKKKVSGLLEKMHTIILGAME